MGTVSDVITGGTKGAVQQGPVRARVLNDLSAEEKERYKADIRATNILLQGYKSHLPQTNKSTLERRSNARNKARVQDGKRCGTRMCRRYNAIIKEGPFQRNKQRKWFVSGIVGGQNRGGIINPGQAKPIKVPNHTRPCSNKSHIGKIESYDEADIIYGLKYSFGGSDHDTFIWKTRKIMLFKDMYLLCEDDALMSFLDEMHEVDQESRHQIQEKDNVIRNLKVLVANVNDRSSHTSEKDNLLCLNEIERSKSAIAEAKVLFPLVDYVKPKRDSAHYWLSMKTQRIENSALGNVIIVVINRDPRKKFALGKEYTRGGTWHNLFSARGKFVILDLEVAFRQALLALFVLFSTTMKIFSKSTYGTYGKKLLALLVTPENFKAKAVIRIFVGYAPSRKGYRIYNKRTRRLMETIHVTFDEMHQSMAPVRMSSGPEPFIMTPGQLKTGLAPTDKELEMLFQPMFDEYLEQPRVNELVPSATEINAQVVPLGTSLSTTIAQDAPSTSASSSTSDMHHPVRYQEITEEPTHEDPPINHDVLHPSHNLDTGEPGSAQSSSGDVNSAEPNQVNYPPDHLRRWTKDHPLDNIVGNPSRPVSTRKQLASDALWCCFHTELSKVEPKNFKMAVIEDCWFQAMQDEIHEFDHLEVWELVPRPIYVMVIALKWIYKVKLDEYGDVLKNKARLVA
ncbi:putative ribonuclease H-like domain-containing protein [Tanacetum coccineum]